ncbi:MAG: hypothetical protein J3R72DRAFT_490820 [Linnemannia gamsii]|nr:MAG: hypothetical protein J3R72DRAFT_490820 [Linnemannia gamsii]
MDLSEISPLGTIGDNDRRMDETIPFVDEYIRLAKARLQITTSTTSMEHLKTSGMDLDCSSNPTISSPPAPFFTARSPGTPKRERSLNQQERRQNRLQQHRQNSKRQTKDHKWHQSKYKSRTDVDNHYSVQQLKIAETKKVDHLELSKDDACDPEEQEDDGQSLHYHHAIINLYEFIFHEWFRLNTLRSNEILRALIQIQRHTYPKKATKPRKAKKPKAAVPALEAAFSGNFATST